MKCAGSDRWLVTEMEMDHVLGGGPVPSWSFCGRFPGCVALLGLAFRASSAARPAGPPAFQRRDWRAGWAAAGAAGAMGWPGFRDASAGDETGRL